MEEKVEFKVGDETLRGSLFVPKGEGPFPGVIFFHGKDSSRVRNLSLCEELGKKRIASFAYDRRGSGQSGKSGEPPFKVTIRDTQVAKDFFIKQGIDRERLGVVGSSYGGYLAALLTSSFPLKSVVLRFPAAYAKNVNSFEEFESLGRFDNPKNWEDSEAFENLKKFEGSLLVFRGSLDDVVPERVVQKYFDSAEKAKRKEMVVLKSGHDLSSQARKEYEMKTLKWFEETL